jgi:cellulose synthase/poly-beta-1,6-N-acetylglucosamine synthase-like glycosyltransferase
MIWRVLFWTAVTAATYVYLGYPAALWLLSRVRPKQPVRPGGDFEPAVSLVVAARNEEQVIAEKVENSLALDYPTDKLEIVVVSDGSTDRTASIVRAGLLDGVRLVELPHNLGKAAAQNEAVRHTSGDIVIFTDAEAFLAPAVVSILAGHFEQDAVGCVVGKVAYSNEKQTDVAAGEGLYWRYELFIRSTESDIGSLASGSGAVLAVRRPLAVQLDPDVSEDFVLPIAAALRGYRTVYEPRAVASINLAQVEVHDMLATRVRTTTLDTRGLWVCRAILNPLHYPLYSWGLISHKLLRWLVPYFLTALFAANLLLVDRPLYQLTLALQVIAYGLAAIGYVWQSTGRRPPRIFAIPFSFCLVNLAALIGVARFLMGKRAGRWEPVRDRAG